MLERDVKFLLNCQTPVLEFSLLMKEQSNPTLTPRAKNPLVSTVSARTAPAFHNTFLLSRLRYRRVADAREGKRLWNPGAVRPEAVDTRGFFVRGVKVGPWPLLRGGLGLEGGVLWYY